MVSGIGVALAYGASAWLAHLHPSGAGGVSPMWPAAGVATGALLLGGWRLWPAVTAGAGAAAALTDAPLLVTIACALGATLSALVGCGLWRRVAQRFQNAGRLGEGLAALIASFVAPLVSASLGVGALAATGLVAGQAAPRLALAWWAADALGMLAVAPVLLAARERVRVTGLRDARRLLVVIAAAALACWLALFVPNGGVFLFAVFPVLLLTAIWFGVFGTRLLALLIAAAAIAVTYAGFGPFVGAGHEQSFFNLQVFLGALAIAALALPAFRSGENVSLPVLVLLGGWTLSGWVFLLLQGDALRRQEEFFSERIAEAQALLRMRMTSYADALRGGASFFAASHAVRRDDWRVYAQSLQLKERYPGINGIGVIFAVPMEKTEEWLTAMRADGAPQMKLSPFPATKPWDDAQYIITYVEPIGTNTASLGRNIATEPTRRAAAERARDRGEAQLHHRAEGSRDLQRRSGLLLYQPLYATGAPVDSVSARRAAHVGWIYAQIFPEVFLEGVLGPTGDIVQLHFFEAGSMSRQRLLYASDNSAGGDLPTFERVTRLELAGQQFQLGWRRGTKFPVLSKSAASLASCSLAVTTVLLAGLIMSLQSTGRRANAIAAERTAELEASEARFRHAFEFAGTGMALVGLDGRWMRVNKSLCDIVGYSEPELLQKRFQDITHPDDLPTDLASLHEFLDGALRFSQREKRYLHRDGHVVWVRLTVSLVRDPSSRPVHFISQIEDITVAKGLEENLARARDEAVEASRLKSEFLATMSHEIRTPMNGVIGMTTLLRDTPLTPAQEDHVRMLESSSELLLTIINRILDYSKIEANRMELELAPFDLRTCVEEASGLFAARAAAKQLRLECRIAPTVPARAIGDAMRLRQILVNLLDNAIKFTERGTVTLTAKAELPDAATRRQRVHIEVRDTGIGIAPTSLHRLFKSFSQVDASTTRRFGGTGLGLAISKRLTELMGGSIWVESTPGEGSTFHFNVQLEIPAEHRKPEQPVDAVTVNAQPTLLAATCPLQVLIAEDNLVNQRVASQLLKRLGYQPTLAANGVEALAAMDETPFDVILMDVEMPELDGYEATRRIRAARRSETRPWIIALTAAAMQDDRDQAFASGMNDFLTKPVRPEDLAIALRRAYAELNGQPTSLHDGTPA